VHTDRFIPLPGYQGHAVASDCPSGADRHIVATQPKATLALIAKLREAVALVEPYRSGTRKHWSPDECRRVDQLLEIEVPE